jgi:hypothetical protein
VFEIALRRAPFRKALGQRRDGVVVETSRGAIRLEWLLLTQLPNRGAQLGQLALTARAPRNVSSQRTSR